MIQHILHYVMSKMAKEKIRGPFWYRDHLSRYGNLYYKLKKTVVSMCIWMKYQWTHEIEPSWNITERFVYKNGRYSNKVCVITDTISNYNIKTLFYQYIWNHTVKIRWSYNHLITTMGFAIWNVPLRQSHISTDASFFTGHLIVCCKAYPV